MRKKSDYTSMAKAIGAENVNGVSARNAEAGKYIFKALGEKSQVGSGNADTTKRYWVPVYLENKETGELVRFSAKSVMSAKGLKYPSAIGAERLASIDKACSNNLEVEFTEATPVDVMSRAQKGQTGYFEPYKRYTLNFEPADMPAPEYEGE